ncbi:DUF4199 domain-containing protein [Polaribacter batillariae]|uniref:DUF4199 domain-containing protein n=1 Tax=Polaribacter batillariae TaxID=2808900 RepID=A0ABX7SV97_9FLAO|nr:DUF4199 domain-containing protein [Polaribacter batillariae]QTD37476.1 DUF4199 domain-containing protein [Polaribacter batillariae]
MENQASSKSIILNYGLYYGVVSVIFSLIMYALGQHLEQGIATSLIGFVIMIAFIVLATKKFKFDNGGFMSWGQGVKIGIGVVLIGVIISAIYTYLFTSFIEPEFKNQIIEKSIVQWQDAGMSQDQIDISKQMTEDYFYLSLFGGMVIGGLVLGFIFSAITSAIMKHSEEETY